MAPEATEEATEAVEETVAPEGEEEKTEDAESGALSEYSLEEIYQYIKKREAEDSGEATDGCAADGAEEVEEEEEKEEEEVTTDNAPRIPVTMNGTTAANGAGLTALFNTIKEGGR